MRKNDPILHIAVAMALLTRLPLPRLPDRAFAHQGRSVWAYPVIGLIVGGWAGLVGVGALAANLPDTVAAGLILCVQVIVTGAMHEDGLADAADGLWGGATRERRLDIMRDSRIGSYGVLALVLSIGLRWSCLSVLLAQGIGALVTACVVSRALMPVVMAALPHARKDGLSHAVGRPPRMAVLFGLGLAGIVAVLCLPLGQALAACLCAALTVAGLALLARARIGGQTGDILGASQQLGEIAMLLALVSALG